MSLHFKIEQLSNGIITSNAGLAIVGLLLNMKTNLEEDIKAYWPHCSGTSYMDNSLGEVGLIFQNKYKRSSSDQGFSFQKVWQVGTIHCDLGTRCC